MDDHLNNFNQNSLYFIFNDWDKYEEMVSEHADGRYNHDFVNRIV